MDHAKGWLLSLRPGVEVLVNFALRGALRCAAAAARPELRSAAYTSGPGRPKWTPYVCWRKTDAGPLDTASLSRRHISNTCPIIGRWSGSCSGGVRSVADCL
jgi:hypothetical protein